MFINFENFDTLSPGTTLENVQNGERFIVLKPDDSYHTHQSIVQISTGTIHHYSEFGENNLRVFVFYNPSILSSIEDDFDYDNFLN